jgi:hypothetical protein
MVVFFSLNGVNGDLKAGVLAVQVLHELILAVVPHVGADLAGIGLVVSVTTLMVLAVAYRRETSRAEATLIGLLTCVGPHVNLEVALLGKYLSAVRDAADEEIVAGVGGLDVELKAAGPGEALLATLLGTDEAVYILVATLVMLQVLL